jgi:hypothetical protein
MRALSSGELLIESTQVNPDLIRLDWKGRIAFRTPDEVLNPYLSEVLEQARRNSATIEMHFELIDYLNSSTVAVLVQFLHRVRALGLRLCFTYRASIRWQKLSFEALRVFEHLDKLVQVIAVPGDPPPSLRAAAE